MKIAYIISFKFGWSTITVGMQTSHKNSTKKNCWPSLGVFGFVCLTVHHRPPDRWFSNWRMSATDGSRKPLRPVPSPPEHCWINPSEPVIKHPLAARQLR